MYLLVNSGFKKYISQVNKCVLPHRYATHVIEEIIEPYNIYMITLVLQYAFHFLRFTSFISFQKYVV